MCWRARLVRSGRCAATSRASSQVDEKSPRFSLPNNTLIVGYVYMYIYIYVYVHDYVYVYMYMYLCVYVYVYAYVDVDVKEYICIDI